MPSLSPDICPPELTVSGKSPAKLFSLCGSQAQPWLLGAEDDEIILISVYTSVVEPNGVIMSLSPLGEREGSSYSTGSNYVHVCP